MAEPLDQNTIDEKLNSLPGWSFENDKLKKEFGFEDFQDASRLPQNFSLTFSARWHSSLVTADPLLGQISSLSFLQKNACQGSWDHQHVFKIAIM